MFCGSAPSRNLLTVKRGAATRAARGKGTQTMKNAALITGSYGGLAPLFPKKTMLDFVYDQQVAGSANK
jgi:hypothetical protein